MFLFKALQMLLSSNKKSCQKGSASVEFMFAFLLLFWMCLGLVEVVFQGYNAILINYGSYMGSRGYLVDTPAGTHWKEGAELIALGTLQHTKIEASKSGSEITLSVTNKEMIRTGIIYGTGGTRTGTLDIMTDLGEQEDEFTGDND